MVVAPLMMGGEEMPEPKFGEWQPIATAPRDGIIVDLYSQDYGRLTNQWWDHDDETWCGWSERDQSITHWMPLPPPPEEKGE